MRFAAVEHDLRRGRPRLTDRARLLFAGAAALGPLVLFPLLISRPLLGIAVSLAAVVCVLAARSPAYPLALWAAPSIAIGILGSNPFPNNSVELFLVSWAVLAVLFVLLRDPAALPLRFVFAPPMLLSIGLAILMVARLGGSDALGYGSYKLERFLAENLLFLVVGILIAGRRRDFDVWAGLLLAATTVSALVVTQGLATDPSKFESVGGRFALYAEATPIGLGRDTAAAMLIGVYLILVGRTAGRRLAALAALPVLMIAFVASGSRGPLVGLVVGLVVVLALTLHDRASRQRLLLVAAAVVAAAVLIPQLVPGENTTRVFSILVGNNGGQSLSNGRTEQWSLAWHAFTSHPLAGIGTGGFSALSAEVYPHNIALEAASELGIVGLLFVLGLIVFTGVTLARVWRTAGARDRHRAALVSGLAVSAVVNACVSGDIATNSAVWLAAGLTLGLAGEFAPEAPLEPLRWAGVRLRRRLRTRGEPRPARAMGAIPGATGAMPAQVGAEEFSYDLRVLGAGRSGRVGYSRPARERRIANVTPAIVMREPPPGSWIRGLVNLAARVVDDAPVVFELSRDREVWQALPADVLDTHAIPDGEYYLRATGAGGEASVPVRVLVDNAPPRIRLIEPTDAQIVSGTVRVAAEADDRGSGLLAVRFHGSQDGAAWQELASMIQPPYAIGLDTSTLAEGDYLVRCVARDRAGNDAATEPVRLRVESPGQRAVEAVAPDERTGRPDEPPEPLRIPLERATLWQLERLAGEHAHDPRSEERDALLYSLRPYANADGTIPRQFWDLIREAFDGLVG